MRPRETGFGQSAARLAAVSRRRFAASSLLFLLAPVVMIIDMVLGTGSAAARRHYSIVPLAVTLLVLGMIAIGTRWAAARAADRAARVAVDEASRRAGSSVPLPDALLVVRGNRAEVEAWCRAHQVPLGPADADTGRGVVDWLTRRPRTRHLGASVWSGTVAALGISAGIAAMFEYSGPVLDQRRALLLVGAIIVLLILIVAMAVVAALSDRRRVSRIRASLTPSHDPESPLPFGEATRRLVGRAGLIRRLGLVAAVLVSLALGAIAGLVLVHRPVVGWLLVAAQLGVCGAVLAVAFAWARRFDTLAAKEAGDWLSTEIGAVSVSVPRGLPARAPEPVRRWIELVRAGGPAPAPPEPAPLLLALLGLGGAAVSLVVPAVSALLDRLFESATSTGIGTEAVAAQPVRVFAVAMLVWAVALAVSAPFLVADWHRRSQDWVNAIGGAGRAG